MRQLLGTRAWTALAVLTITSMGCGSTRDDSVFGERSFVGAMAGTSDSGAVSGTFHIELGTAWSSLVGNMSMETAGAGRAVVPLAGTFLEEGEVDDGVTARVYEITAGSFAGEGAIYRIDGEDFNIIQISLSGPDNEACTLSGLRAPDGGDFFCGRYEGDASGTWNFVIVDGAIQGVFDGDYGGWLSGSRTGSSVAIHWSTVFASGDATGAISGSAITGTWRGGGLAGTWHTDRSLCPPPPPPPTPPRD